MKSATFNSWKLPLLLALGGIVCTVPFGVYLLDLDVQWRLERLVAQHARAADFGEPRQIWNDGFDGVPGWKCEASRELRAAKEPTDRVLLFGHPATFYVFYVLVGSDDRAKQLAQCGS